MDEALSRLNNEYMPRFALDITPTYCMLNMDFTANMPSFGQSLASC
jgi:hypothetical protein